MVEYLSSSLTVQIILGLTASVIAALIWRLGAKYSGVVRGPFDSLIAISTTGSVRRFKSFKAATPAIDHAVKKTRKIRFMAIRGFPVTQESYSISTILDKRFDKTRHCQLEFVVIDPDGREAEHRAKVFSTLGVESPETYLHQIRESIMTIQDMGQKFDQFELRLFDEAGAFRMFIFDKFAFVGFYTNNFRGSTTPVLQIKAESPLYEAIDHYFTRVWDRAKPASDNHRSTMKGTRASKADKTLRSPLQRAFMSE